VVEVNAEHVMVQFALVFLGAFAQVAAAALIVGAELGVWIGMGLARRNDARRPNPHGDEWLEQVMDPKVFTPGVAKVGD
jgi:hypothetical protein